jgi:hypothetical protein
VEATFSSQSDTQSGELQESAQAIAVGSEHEPTNHVLEIFLQQAALPFNVALLYHECCLGGGLAGYRSFGGG